jgi:hypothetical protein
LKKFQNMRCIAPEPTERASRSASKSNTTSNRSADPQKYGADLPNAIDASGLIDTKIHGAAHGDDIVQATIAAAFANARTLA